MVEFDAFQLITFLVKFTHLKFHLTVFNILKLDKTQIVSTVFFKKELIWIIFWATVQLFSLLLTCLEFIHFALYADTRNLIVLLFHGMLFMSKSIGFIYFLLCYGKATEFSHLLNCILYKNKSIFNNIQISKLFVALLVFNAVILNIGSLVFLPTITFAVPCFYNDPIYTFVFGDCTSICFRIMATFTTTVFMIPPSGLFPLVVTICWVCLIELKTFMENWLSYLSSRNSCSFYRPKYQLSVLYRQIQIYVILCNECFQSVVFPVVQFAGSVSVISFL